MFDFKSALRMTYFQSQNCVLVPPYWGLFLKCQNEAQILFNPGLKGVGVTCQI